MFPFLSREHPFPSSTALPSSPPSSISTGSMNFCLPWAPVCLCSKSSHTPALEPSLLIPPLPCLVQQTPHVCSFTLPPLPLSPNNLLLTVPWAPLSLQGAVSPTRHVGPLQTKENLEGGQCLVVWWFIESCMESDETGIRPHLCHLLALWIWPRQINYFNFHFLYLFLPFSFSYGPLSFSFPLLLLKS